jgi:hypothetical protein
MFRVVNSSDDVLKIKSLAASLLTDGIVVRISDAKAGSAYERALVVASVLPRN